MNNFLLSWFHPRTLGVFSFLGILGYAATVQASFSVCAVGRVTTVDSGRTIPNGANAGDTEDYWASADSSINVGAPGIYITYTYEDGQAGGGGGGFADSNGCFLVTDDATKVNEVRIYSMTDAGNTVRVHDSPFSFVQTPGNLWYYSFINQNHKNNQTYTYIVGTGDAKWTPLFVGSFVSEAFDSHVVGKSIHIGINGSCPNSNMSAHYPTGAASPNRSNGQITSGNHFLVMNHCTGTSRARHKFHISHEMGHALLALFYGSAAGAVNGDEPNTGNTTNDSDPTRAPNAAVCVADPGYSIDSKEWNSVTFREGYAHWAAASVWSDRNDPGVAGAAGSGQEGSFTWFQLPEDLERYGQGSGILAGGRLENICCTSGCTTSWDSAGTNGDWLRFLWDFYTDTACSIDPSQISLLNIYRSTRLNGGLTLGNYYKKSRAAMAQLNSDSCIQSRWDVWAAWNGVDNDI